MPFRLVVVTARVALPALSNGPSPPRRPSPRFPACIAMAAIDTASAYTSAYYIAMAAIDTGQP
ncbi:MAG: hypothetical protein Q8N47_22185 [Bryobacterales bacterium]|nr:hypothetical protein [Bryobacterales bacterium]